LPLVDPHDGAAEFGDAHADTARRLQWLRDDLRHLIVRSKQTMAAPSAGASNESKAAQTATTVSGRATNQFRKYLI
jgi:hypothetical protein